MKPIIGIPGNILTNFVQGFDHLPISYTPHGFIEGLHAAGAIPTIFPLTHEENAEEYVKSVDAILLAGGQDVSPLNYGEEASIKLEGTNPTRDAVEMAIIKAAKKQQKPILAVCRGIQIYNVASGGTLYQDVSQYPNLNVQHVQASTPETAVHSLLVEKESWLGELYGEKLTVNSYHHQAIKKLANNLRATAWSKDGLIEGVESTEEDQLIIGVQWHPELMIHHDKKAQDLFDAYVEAVIDWQNK